MNESLQALLSPGIGVVVLGAIAWLLRQAMDKTGNIDVAIRLRDEAVAEIDRLRARVSELEVELEASERHRDELEIELHQCRDKLRQLEEDLGHESR